MQFLTDESNILGKWIFSFSWCKLLNLTCHGNSNAKCMKKNPIPSSVTNASGIHWFLYCKIFLLSFLLFYSFLLCLHVCHFLFWTGEQMPVTIQDGLQSQESLFCKVWSGPSDFPSEHFHISLDSHRLWHSCYEAVMIVPHSSPWPPHLYKSEPNVPVIVSGWETEWSFTE